MSNYMHGVTARLRELVERGNSVELASVTDIRALLAENESLKALAALAATRVQLDHEAAEHGKALRALAAATERVEARKRRR